MDAGVNCVRDQCMLVRYLRGKQTDNDSETDFCANENTQFSKVLLDPKIVHVIRSSKYQKKTPVLLNCMVCYCYRSVCP